MTDKKTSTPTTWDMLITQRLRQKLIDKGYLDDTWITIFSKYQFSDIEQEIIILYGKAEMDAEKVCKLLDLDILVFEFYLADIFTKLNIVKDESLSTEQIFQRKLNSIYTAELLDQREEKEEEDRIDDSSSSSTSKDNFYIAGYIDTSNYVEEETTKVSLSTRVNEFFEPDCKAILDLFNQDISSFKYKKSLDFIFKTRAERLIDNIEQSIFSCLSELAVHLKSKSSSPSNFVNRIASVFSEVKHSNCFGIKSETPLKTLYKKLFLREFYIAHSNIAHSNIEYGSLATNLIAINLLKEKNRRRVTAKFSLNTEHNVNRWLATKLDIHFFRDLILELRSFLDPCDDLKIKSSTSSVESNFLSPAKFELGAFRGDSDESSSNEIISISQMNYADIDFEEDMFFSGALRDHFDSEEDMILSEAFRDRFIEDEITLALFNESSSNEIISISQMNYADIDSEKDLVCNIGIVVIDGRYFGWDDLCSEEPYRVTHLNQIHKYWIYYALCEVFYYQLTVQNPYFLCDRKLLSKRSKWLRQIFLKKYPKESKILDREATEKYCRLNSFHDPCVYYLESDRNLKRYRNKEGKYGLSIVLNKIIINLLKNIIELESYLYLKYSEKWSSKLKKNINSKIDRLQQIHKNYYDIFGLQQLKNYLNFSSKNFSVFR